ncbi:MAG: hypothetical protein LCI02_17285 [Proteobacteria bacterium]|nr:hypothetical protein [Pseudomonadota bacterium]
MSRAALAGLALVACAAGCEASAAATAPLDPLQRPATIDRRAGAAVLLAVARAGERLVAVGEAGIVLLSDDHGKTWRQAAVPVSVTLTGVRFVSPNRGFAVGHAGVLLRTDDAGAHWSLLLDGNRIAALELQAASAAAAPAARLAAARRLVADGADKPLLDIDFADAQRGWAVGAYGLLLATDDGGSHWQSAMGALPNPKGKHLYRIRVLDGRPTVVGEQGAVFRSADGGRSFTEVAGPYAGTYFDVLGAAGGAELVAGLRGHVFRIDREPWQPVATAFGQTLTAATRLSDGTLVLADEAGHLLCSSDGGHRFSGATGRRGWPWTGLAQAADGAVVLTSARGVARIERSALCQEARP